ncbi:hypothetical protein [Nocardia aurea]|uniref:hypothetical protein n=1 Tax=Nocardia aurea TaxID=2144174 RepID=UPI0033A4BD7B
MLKNIGAAFALAAALLVAAPTASADDGPDEILAHFLEGVAGAFGSSGGGISGPKQTSTIYPDAASCYAEAGRQNRNPNVRLAECNPVGGASGQYQLIVMTR